MKVRPCNACAQWWKTAGVRHRATTPTNGPRATRRTRSANDAANEACTQLRRCTTHVTTAASDRTQEGRRRHGNARTRFDAARKAAAQQARTKRRALDMERLRVGPTPTTHHRLHRNRRKLLAQMHSRPHRPTPGIQERPPSSRADDTTRLATLDPTSACAEELTNQYDEISTSTNTRSTKPCWMRRWRPGRRHRR